MTYCKIEQASCSSSGDEDGKVKRKHGLLKAWLYFGFFQFKLDSQRNCTKLYNMKQFFVIKLIRFKFKSFFLDFLKRN